MERKSNDTCLKGYCIHPNGILKQCWIMDLWAEMKCVRSCLEFQWWYRLAWYL